MCQSHQILMNKFLKSPYLDDRFQHTLAKYSKILNLFLLSSLTHSHIWLIPCMDNCQCGYKKLIIIIIFIFIFILFLLKLCLGYVSYNTKGNNYYKMIRVSNLQLTLGMKTVHRKATGYQNQFAHINWSSGEFHAQFWTAARILHETKSLVKTRSHKSFEPISQFRETNSTQCPSLYMLFHTSTPHILHKKCSSCIPQYPTFFTNSKALPTIPNVLHKLQNLAHNTQHSSQIAKPCSYSTINPNTRFTKRKICICYSTQYPTFFTNGKSLVAIPHQYGILQKQQKPRCYSRATTPGILHQKPHCHSNDTQYCCYSTPTHPTFFAKQPHCNSDNTQYSSHIAKPCCYSTNIQYKISPNKDLTFLHTEKIFILQDNRSKLSSSLL